MVGSACFAGVAVLTLAAPFELTDPVLRLPRQSVSSLEAAVLCAFACATAALAVSRRAPDWRTPLTQPWIALLLAMLVASVLSPISRTNALHMTGRLVAALGIYLVTVNAIVTRTHLRRLLALAVAVGVGVSVLAILEYRGVEVVLAALEAFRPAVATIGAHVRAGGPLQYPTLASMYLEVVFACGLGVLLTELDAARYVRVGAVFFALAVIAEAITLTFTRAGLVAVAISLLLVGIVRRLQRGREAGSALIAGLAGVIALLFMGSRPAELVWLRLTSEGQESWYRATIVAPATLDMPADRLSIVPITVTNAGRVPWDSHATPPTLLSYHWLAPGADRFVVFEGERTPFAAPVAPNATVRVDLTVRGPRQPGPYRIEWDLVQEGRLWFSTEPGGARAVSRATIRGDAFAEPVVTMPPPRPTLRPGRLILWRAAARMFAAHPLVGVGPDNFRLAYGSYAGLTGADERTHSNNMYLEVAAGGGLLAVAAFGWLAWRSAKCAAGIVTVARGRPTADAIGLGLTAAVVAIGVHATVDSFLSFTPAYVLFSLTLGCVVACARGMEAWPDAHRV